MADFLVSGGDCGNMKSSLLMSAYVVSISLFYIRMTAFVQSSSAALLNVSVLTSDIYSVLFVVLTTGVVPSFMYFVGTFFVFAGVFAYSFMEKMEEGEVVRGGNVKEQGEGDGEEDRMYLRSSADIADDDEGVDILDDGGGREVHEVRSFV